MYAYDVPPLSPEEKQLPIAKYYEDYPLYKPAPLYQQILAEGPMDPAEAILAQNWLDLLDIHGTRNVVYGYCMMPDGSGFYIEYSVTPPAMAAKPMRRWFGRWVNIPAKGSPKGQGNLRYKLWNPVDHWDHHFVNGVDDRNGVWSLETLDMGKSGGGFNGIAAVSHNLDLTEYGLTAEKKAELDKAGCNVSACYEEFEGHPGHHLVLRFSRPCPAGGMENINCEWIGYWAQDGKILRDEATPVDEEYLRNVLIHNTVERAHLAQLLPDLWQEYHDKPLEDD